MEVVSIVYIAVPQAPHAPDTQLKPVCHVSCNFKFQPQVLSHRSGVPDDTNSKPFIEQLVLVGSLYCSIWIQPSGYRSEEITGSSKFSTLLNKFLPIGSSADELALG